MSTRASVSSAGSRRFWITVLIFAIANAGVWVAYGHWQKQYRRPLEVLRFTPGDGALVEGRARLSWSFNLDVAPTGENTPPPVRFVPAIAGAWHWPDPRTLTFTPDNPLPRATPFIASLQPEAFRTAEGLGLARVAAVSFHTAALDLVDVRQVAVDETDRAILDFQFTDVTLPGDLQHHLSLRGPDGKPLAFKPHGLASGSLLRVITDPLTRWLDQSNSTFINATVSHGLAGAGGPLGLTRDVQQHISIASDIIAVDATAFAPADREPTIRLRFNNHVDVSAVRGLVMIEPTVPLVFDDSYGDLTLRGPFQPGTRYAIKIGEPPAGTAKLHLPRPTTLSVLVPDRSPGLWFEQAQGYLSSAGNRAILAHAVNFTDLRVTVTRVYENNLVAWRTAADRRGWNDPLAFGRPIASRDVHLTGEKNKPQDVRISLDELLSADDARDGVYQVAIAATRPGNAHRSIADDDDNQFSDARAQTLITLSDIALTSKQGRDGLTVWATSLRSAKPLAGVRARLFSNKNQLLGESATDSDGLAKITNVNPAPDEHPAVIVADNPTDERSPTDLALAQTASARSGSTQSDSARARIPRGLTWLDLQASALSPGDSNIGGRPYLRTGYEAFVFTDRGVYRPGETVHLRAIVRGAEQVLPPKFPVKWQLRRPDLHDWKSQVVEIDADGAATMELQLPTDLPTGRWSAHIGLPGDGEKRPKEFGAVSFLVEEFIPQRMKVAVELGAVLSSARVAISDKPLPVNVQADYLFGRPAENLPAGLVARLDPAKFDPAQCKGWTFGDAADTAAPLGHAQPVGRRKELTAANLNNAGHAQWKLDLNDLLENGDSTGDERPAQKRGKKGTATPAKDLVLDSDVDDYAGPWKLTVTASVTEAGGRAVNATRQAEVDRLPYYIGIRPREISSRPGVSGMFDVKLVTPSGVIAPFDATLEIKLFREIWNTSYVLEEGRYRFRSARILEPIERSTAVASIAGGNGEFAVTPPDAGNYVLIVREAKTGSATTFSLNAYSGAWEDSVSRDNPERLEVSVRPAPASNTDALFDALGRFDTVAIFDWMHKPAIDKVKPDTGGLRIGRPAQVVIRSPFPGQLLLAIETDGVVSTHVYDMPTSHMVVPIDVTDACLPNAYVTASVVRAIDPNARWRTHRAFGVARMVIDESRARLNVAIDAPTEIRPTSSLAVPLRVTDAAGAPVANAAVTVAAVDEGICALTRFTTPDPLAFFMAHRALDVKWADLYGQLLAEIPAPGGQSATGGDEPAAISHTTPVAAKRVRPVALWSGVVHTDTDGLAQADFSVPEFAGRLRLMAVASGEKQFGSGEAGVFVRSPLLVQSSWPRFAAPGDRFSVPLVVFNNTNSAGEASVSIELSDGPLQLAVGANKTSVTLPPVAIRAGGQAIVGFDIIALDRAGVSRARLIAHLNGEIYQESIEIPVRPASPAIAVGGYAVATPETPALITIPGGMLDGTARLEVRVSPQPQLQVPEGLDYLDHYPYGCLEQTTSTLFPLVYLPDIGKQIAPGMFDRERVADKVRMGVLRMMSMQTADGGLAMWPGASADWPWGSVYAAHFLLEARSAGYAPPEEFVRQVLTYVRGLLNRPEEAPDTIETQAYAAYVLALAGQPQRAVMSRLNDRLATSPSSPARLHLALAWLAAGRRDMATGLIPAGLPTPRAATQLGGALGSSTRDHALLIDALLAIDPHHAGLPDLVQGLANIGSHNQWRSTQDVAFAVMAIGKYTRQNAAVVPYDSAELRSDDRMVATTTAGRPLYWTPAASPVGAGGKIEVRAAGSVGSVAHVAWLQTGVPLKAAPASDNGMEIRRRYLDEHGDPLEGKPVRSGDLVRIELTLSSAGPLEHVVIDDLLPAGLEIENPRLQDQAAEKPIRRRRGKPAAEAGPFEFQTARVDMRDDRLVLVGDVPGAHPVTYIYTARAITAGSFVVPPVKAMCMYDFGTFSQTDGGRLVVLPAGGAVVAGVGGQ